VICLVTDRRRLSDGGADGADRLVELVRVAATSGVDLIQVRERDLETGALISLVRRCVDAVRGTPAKIVVNDRADVALAAGADGTHLRADSIDAVAVRTLLPSEALVGRSVHGAGEAGAVSRAGGVDYLVFGTVFQTGSKDRAHRLTTLDELSDACRLTSLPILAIGGITVERAAAVARAGAAGIAAIGLFIPPAHVPAHDHLRSIVTDLRRVFDTCGAVP
jgi:thiamine-phosphate pyrophosphorylase